MTRTLILAAAAVAVLARLVWSVTATRRIESDEGEFVDLRSPQARRTELYAGLVVLAIVVAIGGALFITASSIGLGEMIVDILGWMIIGTILVIAGSPLFDMLSVRRKRRACKNDPTTRWRAYWKAEHAKQISQLRLILTEIELGRDQNKKAPASDRGSD